jgi:hypothetical protein
MTNLEKAIIYRNRYDQLQEMFPLTERLREILAQVQLRGMRWLLMSEYECRHRN